MSKKRSEQVPTGEEAVMLYHSFSWGNLAPFAPWLLSAINIGIANLQLQWQYNSEQWAVREQEIEWALGSAAENKNLHFVHLVEEGGILDQMHLPPHLTAFYNWEM